MRIELTVRRPDVDVDVRITGPPGTRFGDLRAELARACGIATDAPLWSGGRLLAAGDLLGAASLRRGCRLSTEPPTPDGANGVATISVVAGPHAGREIRLDRPRLTMGRSAGCDVVLDDPDTSRRHAELLVGPGAITIRDLGSTNGTIVDGAPVGDEPVLLVPGARVRIGDSLLAVGEPTDQPERWPAVGGDVPDPVALRHAAAVPTARLWERHPDHGELLRVRLGVGVAAPLQIDLCRGALALTGPQGVTAGLARWIVGQLAVLCSPAVVRIVVVTAEAATDRWRWCRWLPHVRARVRSGTPECGELLDDLGASWHAPWTLVVADLAGEPAAAPGLATVLRDGPARRVSAAIVAPRQASAISACSTIARVTGDAGTLLSVSAIRSAGSCRPAPARCVPDQVELGWADDVARSLAPLGDVPGCAGAPTTAADSESISVAVLGYGAGSTAGERGQRSSSSGPIS